MFIRSVHPDHGLDAFRAEVRDFCKTHMPAEIRDKQQRLQHLERNEYDAWLKLLGRKGWLTGKWPRKHGGLEWEPEQFLAFEEELGRAGAPPLETAGFALAGPVIYTFGTPEQKQKYLEDIARNNTWWCQGYSEPEAGSDLASLRTRAVRDGDHYVVNGRKIWTSLAHWADMMFALVRTNPEVKKQEGISFLLIDMKTPGITVRPIVGITLHHHLNEVFFDNVRVPVENLIGEENKGWTYAKFLLANERVHSVSIAKFEGYLAKVRSALRQTRKAEKPLAQSPVFKRKMAELEVKLAAVKALLADQLAAARTSGSPPMLGAAALKLRGTELQQAILQVGVEVLGRHGPVYQNEALDGGWTGDFIGPGESPGLMHEHLHRRASTVYSGSNEIQRNIIAKGALGALKEKNMTVFSTEERQLLDDSLQAYFSENYGFERWKQLKATPGAGYGRKEWQDYADLGWLGVALPEEAGGSGGGATELGILMAAAGRHMILEPLLGTVVLGARAIEVAGSERQRGALLPDIAAGKLQLAFCHAEPDAGYERDFVQTIARPDGSGFMIDGDKAFALGARAADALIVSARLGSADGPVNLFVIPGDSRGLARTVAPALDGRPGAACRFENVHVGNASRLGEDDTDRLPLIDSLVDRGAIAVCAEACGAMAAATSITVDYLKVRQQFGQPLSKFQVLQHRLVDMSLACEEARAIVHAALDALDRQQPDAWRTIWQAKVVTAQSARFVGAQSLQLHGGIGMTDELAIGHFYKRLCVCEAQFGDADWYLSKLSSRTEPTRTRARA